MAEFLLVFLVLGLPVLWLGGIIDCLQTEEDGTIDKLIWLQVTIFLGPIGTVIYLVMRRRKTS